MPEFVIKYLRKPEVAAICGDYIRQLEANQLREHLKVFAQRFADNNPMELEDSQRLKELLEAERERLVATAEGGG